MRRSLTIVVVLVCALASTSCSNWPRNKAEQGDAEAQYNLGVNYDKGRGGVLQDHAEAAKWYLAAAEQGYTDAQYNLGSLYADGLGVPQDHGQAAAWFRRAAEQGLRDAQYDLALLYDEGQGVTRDPVEAARWYRLAADQGLIDAIFNLRSCTPKAGSSNATTPRPCVCSARARSWVTRRPSWPWLACTRTGWVWRST